MQYLSYILIGAALILLVWFVMIEKRKVGDEVEKSAREEGKKKIMEALTQRSEPPLEGKITNDNVQELLGVSDATATRYLDELEKDGKIIQKGDTGRGVYYEEKRLI